MNDIAEQKQRKATKRVVQTNRIVHNDLELGYDKVIQRRGPNDYTEEQRIELMFIFRTVAEIKWLDLERYTRVGLHTDGPLIEYRYDEASEDEPDDERVIKPHVNNHRGRWLRVDYVDHEARRMLEEIREHLCLNKSN